VKIAGRMVFVHGNNFEGAMKKFKKKVAQSNILNELREKEFYIKPTIEKKLRKNSARARWRKYLQSQELPKKQY
jgi:small subunit ribosomal protein S21